MDRQTDRQTHKETHRQTGKTIHASLNIASMQAINLVGKDVASMRQDEAIASSCFLAPR